MENTASAFAAAIDGDYAIECDLQLTRDGEAVVFHDETLDRLTDRDGGLLNHSVSELKAVAFKSGPDRIQTLGELLGQVQGRAPLVIEIKSQWDGNEKLVRRAIEVVRGYYGPFALMSFDPKVVELVRSLAPELPRGIVADQATHSDYDSLPAAERLKLRELAHLPRTEPDFISYYFRDLPYPPVANFRRTGRPVITWTIRSRQDAATAMRYSDQVTFEGFRA
jgi:glycerophosphoryl diester phosphodiesterase